MQYGTKTRLEAEKEADREADIPVDEAGGEKKEEKSDSKPSPLCISGIVKKAKILERQAAILDVPAGTGRVLFFSWNPLHRYQNHHDFAFLTNALIFYNDFPDVPTEVEMKRREEPANSGEK